MRLLCLQHQTGDLSEETMLEICGERDEKIWKKFDELPNSKYQNKRLHDVMLKREKFTASRRDSIMKRWDKTGKPLSKKKISATHKNNIRNTCVIRMENENENENRKKKDISIKNIIPPKLEWVQEYCEERDNGINAQEFIDHYETRGWVPKGYNKMMKDWQAAIRTWEKHKKDNPRPKMTNYLGGK